MKKYYQVITQNGGWVRMGILSSLILPSSVDFTQKTDMKSENK